eukprot:gene14710-31280_t
MKHLTPQQAWAWLQAEGAQRTARGEEPPLFVDVRMEIESLYVGRPPGVENIPWYEYPDLTPDPVRFAKSVEQEAGDKQRPVLLICRSGKRTLDAGKALEAAGFKVERKINLGGTLVAHEALKSGAIDLYPEYTGTGLNAVMKAQGVTETDPEKVRGMVKAFYEKEFNLTWLKPSNINNGYAIVVRPETAKEFNLKTLSDL